MAERGSAGCSGPVGGPKWDTTPGTRCSGALLTGRKPLRAQLSWLRHCLCLPGGFCSQGTCLWSPSFVPLASLRPLHWDEFFLPAGLARGEAASPPGSSRGASSALPRLQRFSHLASTGDRSWILGSLRLRFEGPFSAGSCFISDS